MGNLDIPQVLRNGKMDYDLVPDGDPRREFVDRGDYERVEGRTAAFLVFAARTHTAQRARLILHSPQTLAHVSKRLIAEKIAPWCYDEVLSPHALAALRSPEALPAEYKDMLWYDGKVEADSMRFFNEVSRSSLAVPDEFWPVLLLWLRDESNHSAGFRAVYDSVYGPDPERRMKDDSEVADFLPLGEIMRDPFALLIALAYDEFLTIHGYRKHMQRYKEIGEASAHFVRRVIADEGWHLQKFLRLAVRHYPHRSNDIDAVLALTQKADDTPYANTFIFDRGEAAGAKQVQEQARLQARTSVRTLFLRMLKVESDVESKHASAGRHQQPRQADRDARGTDWIAH